MGIWKKVPEELKNKILDSVKNNWIPVSQASKEYWVWAQTIRWWLKKEVTTNGWWVDIRELNRLKKDKEDLLKLVWALSMELDKVKKKNF